MIITVRTAGIGGKVSVVVSITTYDLRDNQFKVNRMSLLSAGIQVEGDPSLTGQPKTQT